MYKCILAEAFDSLKEISDIIMIERQNPLITDSVARKLAKDPEVSLKKEEAKKTLSVLEHNKEQDKQIGELNERE